MGQNHKQEIDVSSWLTSANGYMSRLQDVTTVKLAIKQLH